MRLHDLDIPADASSVLIVDLDAIAHNYRQVQALAPGAEVGVSIKADAYGLGAASVGSALTAAGCETFFVATAAEGVALRAALRDASIVVLNGPDKATLPHFFDHDLLPALNSLAQIDLWRAAPAGPNRAGAYLHLDTGMSRLGLGAGDVAALIDTPERLDGVAISTVMSHLACADEPDSPMNPRQRDALLKAAADLAPLTGPVRTSLANSAGALLGSDFHLDMVRAGAVIYGIDLLQNDFKDIKQTAHLYAKIVQVRDVEQAATVGYGATHKLKAGNRVATVATGYADGYIRSAGRLSPRDKRTTATAYISGTAAPVIGRVSMDLMTIDLSGVHAEQAQPGTLVELMGDNFTADELADVAGTIGYEVLTRLGSRHHRIYRGGATG